MQSGIGTTVQYRGRVGHQDVPLPGWLDGPLALAANALLGNPLDAAVLELRGMGTVLRVKAEPVRTALAGRISATLRVGYLLQLGSAESGCAYLAVAGGLQVEPHLGSHSSNGSAGLCGMLGRAFRPGDALPCGDWRLDEPQE